MLWTRSRKGGFAVVEIIAVVGVIALLLAMGFMVYRTMRLSARVVVAEQNLKQVSTGMELYFRQYNSYPPQGSDLVTELGPFVENPDVFNNPLMEEETPGDTLNTLYRQPTIDEVDTPDNYVTALVADNGRTVVVLKTGHKVERHDDIRFSPADPTTIVDVFVPPGDGEEEDEGFDPGDGGGVTTRTCSDLHIDCVGSQFGYADGTLVDIVVEAHLGDGWFDLYGGQPVSGGETFEQQSVPAGTTVNVKGEIAGAYERWLWTRYGYPLSYTSNDQSDQVETLLDGDTPLCLEPGFPCQVSVGELLAPFVDPQNSHVVLAENEALFLWDFNPLWTEYGIDFQDLIIWATTVATEEPAEAPPEPEPEPQGYAIGGRINLNPNNNDRFEFELEKPDGSTTTRDDLHNSGARLTYPGPAVRIVVRPKGNGNQNGLTRDGQPYQLRNGTTYTITSEKMTVNLYNTRPGQMRQGQAMGKWWLEIDASNATIEP